MAAETVLSFIVRAVDESTKTMRAISAQVDASVKSIQASLDGLAKSTGAVDAQMSGAFDGVGVSVGQLDATLAGYRNRLAEVQAETRDAGKVTRAQAAEMKALQGSINEVTAAQATLISSEARLAAAQDDQTAALDRQAAANTKASRATRGTSTANAGASLSHSRTRDTVQRHTAAVKEHGNALTHVGSALQSQGTSLSTFGRDMTAISIPIAALGAVSIYTAGEFQASMEKLRTQAGYSQASVKKLSSSVIKDAPQWGMGPNALAQALYHVASDGIPASKAMDVLHASIMGAKVGGSDLAQTTYALVSILKSAPKDVKGASDAMAIMNAIVGQGDMTMQNLVDALSTGVIPAAKNWGITLRGVGAALDVFTSRGVPAQVAATRLTRVMQLMGDPSGAAAKQLQSIGLSSTKLAQDMRQGGLPEALTDLKKHLDDTFPVSDSHKLTIDQEKKALADYTAQLKAAGVTGSQLTQDQNTYAKSLANTGQNAIQQAALLSSAFGGARGGTAMQLMIQNLDDLKKHTDALDKGDLLQNFKRDVTATEATIAYKADNMKAAFESFAIVTGNALMPLATTVFKDLTTGVTDLEHAFQGMPKWAKEAVEGIAIVGAVAAPLAITIGGLEKGIGTLSRTAGRILPGAAGSKAEQLAASAGLGSSGGLGGIFGVSGTAVRPGSLANAIAVQIVGGGGRAPAATQESGVAKDAEAGAEADAEAGGSAAVAARSAAPVVEDVAAGAVGETAISDVVKSGITSAFGAALKGGAIGTVGYLASQIAGGAIGGKAGGDVKSIGGDASIGAGVGGTVGSIVPGVGTLAGALGGAALGGLIGAFQKFAIPPSYGDKVASATGAALKKATGVDFLAGKPEADLAANLNKVRVAADAQLPPHIGYSIPGRSANPAGGYVPPPATAAQKAAAARVLQMGNYAAGQVTGAQFAQKASGASQFIDVGKMVSQLKATLATLPPATRAGAASAVEAFAKEWSAQGLLYDGTFQDFVKGVGADLQGAKKYSAEAAAATTQGFAQALNFAPALAQFSTFGDKIQSTFGGVLPAVNLTFGNAASQINAQVQSLMQVMFESLSNPKAEAAAQANILSLQQNARTMFSAMAQQVDQAMSTLATQAGANTGLATQIITEGYSKQNAVVGQELAARLLTSQQTQKQIESNLSSSLGTIRSTLNSHSQDAQKTIGADYQASMAMVASAVKAGEISVKGGLKIINDETMSELKQLVGSGGARGSAAGVGLSVGKGVGALGAATGGVIGRWGERGQDTVLAMLGRGEAVLNGPQQDMVNRALAGQGIGGLPEVFARTAGSRHYASGGFVEAPGTNYTAGVEPQIAADLAKLGQFLHTTITGISGYRSPSHSVAVGGFADDPHTRGEASDIEIPGVNMLTFPEADFRRFGLFRPFYPPDAHEDNHVQLISGGISGEGGGAPVNALTGVTGGAGAMSMVAQAVAAIKEPKWTGPGGMLGQIGEAVLSKATKAANARLRQAGGSVGGATGLTGHGKALFDKTYASFISSGSAGHVTFSPQQIGQLASMVGLPPAAFETIAMQQSGDAPGIQQPSAGVSVGPGGPNVGYGLLQNTPNSWGNSSAAYAYMQSLGGIPAMFNPYKNFLMGKFLYDAAGKAGDPLSPWGMAGGGFAGRRYAGAFAAGGMATASSPTMALFGDNGPETAVFLPHYTSGTAPVVPGVPSYLTSQIAGDQPGAGATMTTEYNPATGQIESHTSAQWALIHAHNAQNSAQTTASNKAAADQTAAQKKAAAAAKKALDARQAANEKKNREIEAGGVSLGSITGSKQSGPITLGPDVSKLDAPTWAKVLAGITSAISKLAGTSGAGYGLNASGVLSGIASAHPKDARLRSAAGLTITDVAKQVATITKDLPSNRQAGGDLSETRDLQGLISNAKASGNKQLVAALQKDQQAAVVAYGTAVAALLKNQTASTQEAGFGSEITVLQSRLSKARKAGDKALASAFASQQVTALASYGSAFDASLKNLAAGQQATGYASELSALRGKLKTSMAHANKTLTAAIENQQLTALAGYTTAIGNVQSSQTTASQTAGLKAQNAFLKANPNGDTSISSGYEAAQLAGFASDESSLTGEKGSLNSQLASAKKAHNKALVAAIQAQLVQVDNGIATDQLNTTQLQQAFAQSLEQAYTTAFQNVAGALDSASQDQGTIASIIASGSHIAGTDLSSIQTQIQNQGGGLPTPAQAAALQAWLSGQQSATNAQVKPLLGTTDMGFLSSLFSNPTSVMGMSPSQFGVSAQEAAAILANPSAAGSNPQGIVSQYGGSEAGVDLAALQSGQLSPADFASVSTALYGVIASAASLESAMTDNTTSVSALTNATTNTLQQSFGGSVTFTLAGDQSATNYVAGGATSSVSPSYIGMGM